MFKFQKYLNLALVLLGIALALVSFFYASSFLAIVGVTLIFWGAILYYVKPTKLVPFSFVTAVSNSSTDNIDKVLSEINFVQKGYYLPPKSIQNEDVSLVFIPKNPFQPLPTNSDITNGLFTAEKDGLLLTPPGFDLSKMIEQKFGQLFSMIDLQGLQKRLPILLVEELEIAEKVNIYVQNLLVTFEIQGSIFFDECKKTKKYSQAHAAIGCLLSSSLACILAKVTGKAVTIENEEISDKTTIIQFLLIEE